MPNIVASRACYSFEGKFVLANSILLCGCTSYVFLSSDGLDNVLVISNLKGFEAEYSKRNNLGLCTTQAVAAGLLGYLWESLASVSLLNKVPHVTTKGPNFCRGIFGEPSCCLSYPLFTPSFHVLSMCRPLHCCK